MSTPTWPCGSSIWSARRSALQARPARCAAAARRSRISNARRTASPRLALRGPPLAARRQPFTELADSDPRRPLGSPDERGRSSHHPGAHAGLEVAPYTLPHGIAAALGLEALKVEIQLTSAAPEMGILEPGRIAEQRVVHLPEAALPRRRLGGAGRRPGPGVAGSNREVTEDELDRHAGQTLVERGAKGTLEVGVLDHQRGARGSSTVIVRSGLGDRRRAETAHQWSPTQIRSHSS